jgi:hypothetical protein
MRVRFVEPARLEILAEVGFYHRVEAGLGAKFLDAVEDATARALAYPLAGSPAPNSTRRVFLRDFPFALVYRPDEQGITICTNPRNLAPSRRLPPRSGMVYEGNPAGINRSAGLRLHRAEQPSAPA